jgi:hypothetical protein
LRNLEPGKCTQTYPGIGSAYVLAEEAVAKIDGKPDVNVKAGQPLVFPWGTAHNVCNISGCQFKALAQRIVEKGKPLHRPLRNSTNPLVRTRSTSAASRRGVELSKEEQRSCCGK